MKGYPILWEGWKAVIVLVLGVGLACETASAQGNNDTVQSGRLICEKVSRLRWDCRVDGNDAQPSGLWIIDPVHVASLFNNTGRTVAVLCDPIDYDVQNNELVKREQHLSVRTTYVLGPTTGIS